MESYRKHDSPVNIIEVVSRYVVLRKAGREYSGACPFHSDRYPSFYVNAEKGFYHCFSCNAGGDAIDFIQRLEGLSYPAALRELGINKDRPQPKPRRLLIEARKLASWADRMSRKANFLLREVGDSARLAVKLRWTGELYVLEREWSILKTLSEDLQDENYIMELYRQRDLIEDLLDEADDEPWSKSDFPPMTAEYWEYVTRLPKPKDKKNG